jgi:hypothetical protein
LRNPWKIQGPSVFLGRLAGETLAHPFHPHPTAAARQSHLDRDFRLSRPHTPRRAVRTAKMRLTDAMQSTFSKTGTRTVAAASGLTRVSLNRPMGNVFSRHAPASARTGAHRSAFSSESGSTSAWPLVPRRRPPRATPSISERTAPGDQSRSSPPDAA